MGSYNNNNMSMAYTGTTMGYNNNNMNFTSNTAAPNPMMPTPNMISGPTSVMNMVRPLDLT